MSYATVAICLSSVAHRWNCHTSKFDSCCAYCSREIRVLRISRCSICFPWATDTVCLVTTRAFIPASLIVIPYTILEISTFLGQLPVDDGDDDDEKCQLKAGIASLHSELVLSSVQLTSILVVVPSHIG